MYKTTEPLPPQPWHAKAIELASQGYTRAQICEAVQREIKSVKAVLSPGYREGCRRRARERMRRNRANPEWVARFNERRRKNAEKKRKALNDAGK